MSIATSFLTAAEFARMPDPGHPQELVRGVIVDMPPPQFRARQDLRRISTILTVFAMQHELGHVLGNDSGVITEQIPIPCAGPTSFS